MAKKILENGNLIMREIEKVLAKHGFAGQKLTKFSVTPITAESVTDTITNCPPNYHIETVCRTVNGVTTCKEECVKNNP